VSGRFPLLAKGQHDRLENRLALADLRLNDAERVEWWHRLLYFAAVPCVRLAVVCDRDLRGSVLGQTRQVRPDRCLGRWLLVPRN
jgi:hypothetical protein